MPCTGYPRPRTLDLRLATTLAHTLLSAPKCFIYQTEYPIPRTLYPHYVPYTSLPVFVPVSAYPIPRLSTLTPLAALTRAWVPYTEYPRPQHRHLDTSLSAHTYPTPVHTEYPIRIAGNDHVVFLKLDLGSRRRLKRQANCLYHLYVPYTRLLLTNKPTPPNI